MLYIKKSRIFYVDADLYFFDNCLFISKKLDKFSIISSVHNFDEKNKFQEKINGKFNVGFIGFKKNKLSLKCIDIWKKQCFFSTTLNESFATVIRGDQLYLNKWPSIFKKDFYSINNKYFNIGAWNINNFKFERRKNYLFTNNKKILMIHANFIEFDNNQNILIDGRSNLKSVNQLIYDQYLKNLKLIGINNSKLISKNIKTKVINFIYKIF